MGAWKQSEGPGVRTRVLLLISLFVIVVGSTAASLFIVRNRLQKHVQEELSRDLQHSVETFQDLEGRRRSALEQENRLLATLPSLKAVMTTSDPRTIAEAADDFWKISGTELFALADADHQVVAAKFQGWSPGNSVLRDLQAAIGDPERHYFLSEGRIYAFSSRPLFFGNADRGTLLGFVVSGYPVDRQCLMEIGRGAGAQAAVVAGDRTLVSSWPTGGRHTFSPQLGALEHGAQAVVQVGGERFLTMSKDLSASAGSPLRLLVLKSFEEADRAEREIDRLLFLASLLALLAGSVLMLLLARAVTRPLEELAAGVRAFGKGDAQHTLPTDGTQEVRYLSRNFARMRDENQKTGRALLEAERLATIGRMASSVSHDLRHYLAAIYANAEFLASPSLPGAERADLFDDIRKAVKGTTDMLDSLLLFGRTGNTLRRTPVTMVCCVERAIALVRAHPDAEDVKVHMTACSADSTALLDANQMERAVYNLLLNACQSARQRGGQSDDPREVCAEVLAEEDRLSVLISDTGFGVEEEIRNSLFDPFVSRGKQKGTGLGLTLASSIAREHGGTVELVSSRPGGCVFRLTVARQPAPITHNVSETHGVST